MNIIELIKSQRYFAKALKTLIPKPKRLELKEKTRYILLDPAAEEKSDDVGMTAISKMTTGRQAELSSGHFSSSSLSSAEHDEPETVRNQNAR